jgi:hypothetical protein
MNTPLQLLKDKRSSAVIDVRAIEIQLARLNESAEPTRIKADLRSVAAMFHEYIATLDESIHDIECVMLAVKSPAAFQPIPSFSAWSRFLG